MTGIELFIVIGGCYAIYTVGMAMKSSIPVIDPQNVLMLLNMR